MSSTSAGTSGVRAASATRRTAARRLLTSSRVSYKSIKVMTVPREDSRHFCSERTMSPAKSRRTAAHTLQLTPETIEEMRSRLPQVADQTVSAIITEVPSYADALTGSMGENIRSAVQLALGGFISLASRRRGADPRTPAAPAVEGAYQLGRGEARSGRSVDALLAAYRIGARVSWREMSATAVRNDVDADTLASFAELVFAYIDELSAASVAGHSDELDTTGQVRRRLLERVAHHLVQGSPADVVQAAAERIGWTPPSTL